METKATIASERDACDIIKVLALLLSSTELVVLAGPFFFAPPPLLLKSKVKRVYK